MSSQNPGLNPTGYIGTNYTNPGQDVFKTRDPLPTDIHFIPGTRWINTASNTFWVLGSVTAGTPKVAHWISSGGGSLSVSSLLLDDANLVNPVAGVIALTGNATQGVSTFMPVAGVAEITVTNAATGQKGVVDSSSVPHGVLIGGATQSNIASTTSGVTGQFLQSGGPAADPNWAAQGLTGQILQSSGVGSNSAWTTATYPSTTTAGQVLLSSANNVVASSPFITATSTGAITTSSQSGMSAYRSADIANVTGDNTAYQVVFDNVNYDIQSEYNNATGLFTVKNAGLYLVVANVTIANMLNTQTQGNIWIELNGSAILVAETNPYNDAASSNLLNVSGSQILQCAAGATIAVVAQVSGGTKTITVKGPTFTTLQISKIA